LTFQGEPLLHKELLILSALGHEAGLKTILFNECVGFLKADLARPLVRAGINAIRLSGDGASQETYGQTGWGGSLPQFYENASSAARIVRERRPGRFS